MLGGTECEVLLNGYEVTRWNMAQYLLSVFGGNPEALISNSEGCKLLLL